MAVAALAVLVLCLAGAAWVLLARRSAAQAEPTLVTSSVSRELTRLDPFSFFVLSGRPYGVDHVVVGTTGTFAITVGSISVDGACGKDASRAKRGARRVRQGAGPAAVDSSMEALVCLPGRQFQAKIVRGAKVIPWGSVVTEIAGRQRSVSPNQAQRIAANLGALPGNGNHAQAV